MALYLYFYWLNSWILLLTQSPSILYWIDALSESHGWCEQRIDLTKYSFLQGGLVICDFFFLYISVTVKLLPTIWMQQNRWKWAAKCQIQSMKMVMTKWQSVQYFKIFHSLANRERKRDWKIEFILSQYFIDQTFRSLGKSIQYRH